MFDLERRLYLAFFLSSAWLATALASLVACMMWEAAKVSTHVASQMRFRPVFQGVILFNYIILYYIILFIYLFRLP